ncbi:hypothetical protein BG004_002248 [Podila humilis]|nr:hypothetical protein BG004_002248 [Podila humilis]
MRDHPSNPLDMPEILLCISAYLIPHDLVACLAVSKLWHQTFMPRLWKKYLIAADMSRRPCLQTLCKHAPHIRNLSLWTTLDLDPFFEHLTNLRTLIIIGGDHFAAPQVWLQLTALVQQNPGIEWIIVGMNNLIGPTAEFLRAIPASCPNLRRYESSMCLYKEQEQIDALLGIFSHAKEVWTRYESYAVSPYVPRTYCFPQLQELALKDPKGLTTTRQVDIICMCPNLEMLKWAVGRDNPIPIQDFVNRVPAACPKLKRLHLDGNTSSTGGTGGSGEGQGENIGQMLDALKDLESLLLFGCMIEGHLFTSLKGHFHSLSSLDVMDSFQFKSSMAMTILENCPNLERLSLALLSMEHVVAGQAWKATKLRELQVDLVSLEGACLMAAGGNKDTRMIASQQICAFEQISRLTELRHLAIGHLRELRRPSLEFRVGLGMKFLRSLTKLRHLSLEGTVQDMTEEDVDWLGQNLRHLDTIEGRLCSAVAGHDRLRQRLSSQFRIDVAQRSGVMEELSIPSGRAGQDLSLEDLYWNEDDYDDSDDDDYHIGWNGQTLHPSVFELDSDEDEDGDEEDMGVEVGSPDLNENQVQEQEQEHPRAPMYQEA